jgi:hypothetical protein
MVALAATLLDTLLGLELASTDERAGNRLSLEGLTLHAAPDGALEFRVRTLAAASLRLAHGPLVLEIGRLELHDVAGQLHHGHGAPRLRLLEAARADLSGVKVQGPVALAPQLAPDAPSQAWSLGPLAAADGTLRCEIQDATLVFDADVTVTIRQGQVDFNDAKVEHVGPDSRMGVSKLGIYVDAPNGRSYLYQFSPAPVAGVQYEQRNAFLGQRVSDRGKLQLQPFAEATLGQTGGPAGAGVTDQARALLERTALTGFVQLGDARFVAPGVQADLSGRAGGANVVRLHSPAVGRELALDVAALSIRQAVFGGRGTRLDCGEITGAVQLRLVAEGTQWRFEAECTELRLGALRLQPFLAPPG